MSYVDGFLLPVKNADKQAYTKLALGCAPVFKQYGALSVVECWGDNIPEGKLTSFPMAVKLEENESVVFSWIVWPSKQVRDDAWPKIHDDERMKALADTTPFDPQRMIFGTFDTIVNE